jgi:hypothetical protein
VFHLDVRIAVITGSVFAGVLVAGALAAPGLDDDDRGNDAAAVSMPDAQPVLDGSEVGDYDDDEQDDERYEDDDDRDDHDDEDDD